MKYEASFFKQVVPIYSVVACTYMSRLSDMTHTMNKVTRKIASAKVRMHRWIIAKRINRNFRCPQC